jgi:hypothetical protein
MKYARASPCSRSTKPRCLANRSILQEEGTVGSSTFAPRCLAVRSILQDGDTGGSTTRSRSSRRLPVTRSRSIFGMRILASPPASQRRCPAHHSIFRMRTPAVPPRSRSSRRLPVTRSRSIFGMRILASPPRSRLGAWPFAPFCRMEIPAVPPQDHGRRGDCPLLDLAPYSGCGYLRLLHLRSPVPSQTLHLQDADTCGFALPLLEEAVFPTGGEVEGTVPAQRFWAE